MLFLTKSDYEKMLAHCKEGLPNEACGLIGGVVEGKKQYVKKVYLLTNMDESNEHFSMDPKEQLAAVKDMRKNGYVPLGNFHSCLLYTSPSPRDRTRSRMPSSA